MPFDQDSKHSPELSQKILELGETLNKYWEGGEPDPISQSLYDMGAGCFFDDMENEDEAKGAIKVLDWIIVGLKG